MVDGLLLIAFVGLPVAMWLLTRSLTWVATRLAIAFGIAGTAVQTGISFGQGWNLRGLQVLVLVLMVLLLLLAFFQRDTSRLGLRRQLIVIVLPMVLIGVFLILMRMLAPEAPGPLTGVGYFINHPLAEDNAKWLHLSSQLSSGNDLVFNGYAGGPLILVMVIVAALISVLSSIMLGGVNEVAVAVNTVIGTSFLLIALIPTAFAPFAERRIPLGPRMPGSVRQWVPAPLVWTGMLVVFLASAVVTSYGHLSLQFVLIVLVLWATVFLIGAGAPRSRLLMTLVIATSASVWLPLNVLGIALLLGCLVFAVKRRDWLSVGLVVITAAAAWDALVSSTLYMFGIDLGDSGVGSAGGSATEGAAGDVAAGLTDQLAAATSLFQAPGGTEIVEPLVGGLALLSLLLVVYWYSKARRSVGLRAVAPFAPIVLMAGYALGIAVGDAIVTGGSPHYGVHKIAFATVIMILGATLPIAIVSLESQVVGMTLLRWFAVGAVVVLLSLDTILPRGLSALSPKLWPAVDRTHPAYWSAAEVRPTGDQPISSLPVACLFAPPTTDQPTGLPQGQQSYNCTRLLIGLNGLEGRAGILTNWLLADWMGNEPHWDEVAPVLAANQSGLTERIVILGKPDGTVGGLATLNDLIARYPVSAG